MPKANSRRLNKAEKGMLVHLLQAPKLTNGDIAKIIDVDERTISRRRKQLRTLGHLSPERNVKGAEKLRPLHLERVIALLEENNDLQLKDVQEFLKKEFELQVTVSTISRQLSRANLARARRPGYKNTRPDLQAPPQAQEPQGQQQQQQQEGQQQGQQQPAQPDATVQDIQLATTDPQQAPVPPQVEDNASTSLPQPASTSPVQATPQQQALAAKLACPFYKHDPQRYAGRPFCQSSFFDVRDVKQHVYRRHMQPKFRCHRCMETFESDNDLMLHQRTPECLIREWVIPEGCSEEQKEKMRKGDKGDENNKWKRMYRILFPDVNQDEVPDGVVYENPAYLAASIDPNLEDWQQAPPHDQHDAV